jgi:hypothetical protein
MKRTDLLSIIITCCDVVRHWGSRNGRGVGVANVAMVLTVEVD